MLLIWICTQIPYIIVHDLFLIIHIIYQLILFSSRELHINLALRSKLD